jgi:F420-dependent oxidoreductase-like protein
MSKKIVGIVAPTPDTGTALAYIRKAEDMGVPAAWLTSGGNAGDSVTLLAIAASQTERILLGTSIMQTWSRHPVTAARQAQTIADIAPGRFRLGVGPSHQNSMIQTFGADFRAPLTHLREYVQVLKGLLQEGKIDLDGDRFVAHSSLPEPVDVPVIASALRPRSFELCGEIADGAITWVCPLSYVRDTALPAMRKAAENAGRPTPQLIVHAPVCVHEDRDAARSAVRQQMGYFPQSTFYARMFAEAGFANSETSGWTDEMLDSVFISGDEAAVAQQLEEVLAWGASEVLASLVTVGDAEASRTRTMKLIAEVSAS